MVGLIDIGEVELDASQAKEVSLKGRFSSGVDYPYEYR